MARIYGWGHWNYTPDAKLMWEFMSKYARDLETGETIRLDLQEPDTPTDNPSDTLTILKNQQLNHQHLQVLKLVIQQ